MQKKSLWHSYLDGVTDTAVGESYESIFFYCAPELVTAFLLCSLLNVIDASFIGHLKSTSMYATQGVTSVLIYFLTKIAEGFSIGTVVLCGQYNGVKNYKHVGRAAMTSFFITTVFGAFLSGFLFFFPHVIYNFFQVPACMMEMGVPFLRIRAVGIFFSFIYFALIGFLRGIKKPNISMILFIIGGIVFIFFDYVLIFGKWGFPALELQGSALAAVIQYGVMVVLAFLYIICDKEARIYSVFVWSAFDKQDFYDIVRLSWPVMVDKATQAASKLWLVRLIAPMGKTALASFSAIRDMSQFAFVPAIALAQVLTFLVSNDYAVGNWRAIKNNVKKVILMALFMVAFILLIFIFWSKTIVSFFDKTGSFTDFASVSFQMLSGLILSDVLQCLLAGSLRGAANVKTVMLTRIFVTVGFFGPISYAFSHASLSNLLIKFVLVYGSFYVSNGVMTLIYVYRFRKNAWKNQSATNNLEEIYDKSYTARDRTSSKNIVHKDR